MEEVINLSIASQAFFFFQLQLTVRKQFSSIIQYTRMCIYTYWIQAKGQEARLFYIQPTDIFFAFFFSCAMCGLQDLSSPTWDQTLAPCSGNAEP